MQTPAPPPDNGVLESLVLHGDLSKMDNRQKVAYYKQFCESLGLNPLTQPFKIIRFRGGQEVMYPKKEATDQLRNRDGISVIEAYCDVVDDILSWTVKGQNKEGRMDIEGASIYIAGLPGEEYANAKMKCLTKAKRRLTLSMVGLGMPDDLEAEGDAVTLPLEPVKRMLSDTAFAAAVTRILAGEVVLIGKLRTEMRLTDAQLEALVEIEDRNNVTHEQK